MLPRGIGVHQQALARRTLHLKGIVIGRFITPGARRSDGTQRINQGHGHQKGFDEVGMIRRSKCFNLGACGGEHMLMRRYGGKIVWECF